MIRSFAVIVYVICGAQAGVGATAGYRAACGAEFGLAQGALIAAAWPVHVSWAAMKAPSPIWKCTNAEDRP